MNLVETGQLLTVAAAFDNRHVTTDTAIAWHEVLTDIDLEDALVAVREHHKHSTEYLMPGHIVAGARRNRERREREMRKSMRALEKAPITFDRESFDREVLEQIEFWRKIKAGEITA